MKKRENIKAEFIEKMWEGSETQTELFREILKIWGQKMKGNQHRIELILEKFEIKRK